VLSEERQLNRFDFRQEKKPYGIVAALHRSPAPTTGIRGPWIRSEDVAAAAAIVGALA
jgi:hypothetical protein